jgi:hypothetical protein
VVDVAERQVVALLGNTDLRCREVLTTHRAHLERLARLLAERETLGREELVAALSGLETPVAAVGPGAELSSLVGRTSGARRQAPRRRGKSRMTLENCR